MITIRRFEVLCDEYYKQKKILGFCHLYDGQEAVIVGINEALKNNDPILGTYWTHGTAILRGVDTY